MRQILRQNSIKRKTRVWYKEIAFTRLNSERAERELRAQLDEMIHPDSVLFRVQICVGWGRGYTPFPR